MAVIATNALETRYSPLGEHRQLLVNIELNNSCAFTDVCGPTCYLNVIAQVGKVPLASELVLAAAREIIQCGENVRHLVLPGKEVFESPELLLEVIEEFHAAPAHTRPGDISIITASSAGLQRHASRLANTPLGAISISLDTPGSGLRSPRNNKPLLDAALRLKELGGTERLGVNSVLTDRNLAGIIQIGKQLQGIGVDQWTLGPLLRSQSGRMESVLSSHQLREIINRVSQEFAGADLSIMFDLDLPLLRGLIDAPEVFANGATRWRFEYELPGAPNIVLEAGNPAAGYFFRMDFSGKLSSKEDYRWIGRPGSYGQYTPGRISRLLEELRELRSEPTLTV
jgi:MoaA/NifB/PqqE/SkfB family radical SAM enzyme